ncbi:hypothetical protein S40293_00288 [Stachybotrys chartarum IBT 40293]|nr:hypothetical protein S40293_00288 [Stachybotrys chartarum IBT 40293]
MKKPIDLLIDSLLILIPLIHLVVAPHTKVEESFNLQAAHDILVYGTPVVDVGGRLGATYDHFTFPGAVPRTFVGPVVLAGLSQPLVALVGFRHAQFVVRAVLGAFNAGALLVLRSVLTRAFGNSTARWWVLLLASQFHVPFYLSRTLPNMFAFGLTTLATAFMIPGPASQKDMRRQKRAIGLLVFATTIFRAELAILLATSGLYLLVTARISLRTLIPAFLVFFLAALGLSVPLDSYFWQKPLWPELWGFYYNAVLGSSSNWGVSPWHYYFTSALPRLLLNPLAIPLIFFSVARTGTSRQAVDLLFPSVAFVAIYSLQPHKEARFIFYVIPSLTAAAALGANYIFSRRAKSFFYVLASLAICGSVLATFAASAGMLVLSSLNYPGGDALAQLYALTRNETSPAVAVHADVLTCMTGLTLFGQNPAGLPLALPSAALRGGLSSPLLLVDKTEDSADLKWPRFWNRMDYALMEDAKKPVGQWEVIGVVEGYSGVEIRKPGPGQDHDVEAGGRDEAERDLVLGKGAVVATVRDVIRRLTGGWWIGPRMTPQIHIMKRIKA